MTDAMRLAPNDITYGGHGSGLEEIQLSLRTTNDSKLAATKMGRGETLKGPRSRVRAVEW